MNFSNQIFIRSHLVIELLFKECIKKTLMKFRITLFVIISGIFIPINSANANANDRDDFYFYVGGFSSVCNGYAMDFVSEKDASLMLNSLVGLGNESINDLYFYICLKNLVIFTLSINVFSIYLSNNNDFISRFL